MPHFSRSLYLLILSYSLTDIFTIVIDILVRRHVYLLSSFLVRGQVVWLLLLLILSFTS